MSVKYEIMHVSILPQWWAHNSLSISIISYMLPFPAVHHSVLSGIKLSKMCSSDSI